MTLRTKLNIIHHHSSWRNLITYEHGFKHVLIIQHFLLKNLIPPTWETSIRPQFSSLHIISLCAYISLLFCCWETENAVQTDKVTLANINMFREIHFGWINKVKYTVLYCERRWGLFEYWNNWCCHWKVRTRVQHTAIRVVPLFVHNIWKSWAHHTISCEWYSHVTLNHWVGGCFRIVLQFHCLFTFK